MRTVGRVWHGDKAGFYDGAVSPAVESPASRCLELRLEGRRVLPSQWGLGSSDFAGFAGWGGVAQGTAWLHERLAEAPQAPALVLAVGECVARALPTAARVTIQGRAPLSGLLASGQVGGALGTHLAAHADFIGLRGRCELSGAVLRMRPDTGVELLERPRLAGASPRETARALFEEFASPAILCIGPAGERGVPFASLAAGVESPSFVGRGGLGASFAALGLKALVIEAHQDFQGVAGEAEELIRLLTRSPRLRARARGGTFELFGALSARGGLRAAEGDRALSCDEAQELFDQAREQRVEFKGCRGCPTPCGWVFDRPDGPRQGARFSASRALGTELGLACFEDSLELLSVCDELAIDAREAGAVLALIIDAREEGRLEGAALRGNLEELRSELFRLVHEESAPGRGGASRLASTLGLSASVASRTAQSVREDSNLAILLGQCVSGGGVDPMRSFPFLTELGGRDRIEAVTGLPIPAGGEDPLTTTAKGRLVVWCENVIAAIDASGFCAFSAVGLLSDGVLSLEELARRILPVRIREETGPGWNGWPLSERLMALGANLILLQRRIDDLLGGRGGPPPFARTLLEARGMLPEYRLVRGFDDEGDAPPRFGSMEVWSRERVRWLEVASSEAEREAPSPGAEDGPNGPRAPGSITLRSSGALAEILGRECFLRARLPLPLGQVVRALSDENSRATRWLFSGKEILPGFWRDGVRLREGSPVASGDVLEVVLAISGG